MAIGRRFQFGIAAMLVTAGTAASSLSFADQPSTPAPQQSSASAKAETPAPAKPVFTSAATNDNSTFVIRPVNATSTELKAPATKPAAAVEIYKEPSDRTFEKTDQLMEQARTLSAGGHAIGVFIMTTPKQEKAVASGQSLDAETFARQINHYFEKQGIASQSIAQAGTSVTGENRVAFYVNNEMVAFMDLKDLKGAALDKVAQAQKSLSAPPAATAPLTQAEDLEKFIQDFDAGGPAIRRAEEASAGNKVVSFLIATTPAQETSQSTAALYTARIELYMAKIGVPVKVFTMPGQSIRDGISVASIYVGGKILNNGMDLSLLTKEKLDEAGKAYQAAQAKAGTLASATPEISR